MEVTHSTFTLERHYPAELPRVYEAWADPEARKRWMARGADYSQDFKIGGHETVRGADDRGHTLSYLARYVDIVPNERILTTSTMHSDGQLSTVSVTSVEFAADGDGTLVVVTEHGIYLPGMERPEWREQGTGQQLDTLAAELDVDDQVEGS